MTINHEADNVEMVPFDFSGRTTNAIGNALLQNSEEFWPEVDSKNCNTVITGAKEIGVDIVSM